ncbi:uncharacterized protein LOC120679951 [Panicum virgatum]|uniref:uncharacterized protein LOC120679951 n=1 Tax=Panicum virgatum TaxID=38727 RepID=UPI0019D52A53|nr:uncharacterized protein LOC120679951 [Panicum virgatum]
MPSSLSRDGRRLVLLAVAVVSLTVATSRDTTSRFTWLDCPSQASAPAPFSSSPPPSTVNSTFPSNVLALLHALPSAAAPTGFASLSRGEPCRPRPRPQASLPCPAAREPAAASSGLRSLCRGDSALDVCSRCLQRAALHIDRHCSSNQGRRQGARAGACPL